MLSYSSDPLNSFQTGRESLFLFNTNLFSDPVTDIPISKGRLHMIVQQPRTYLTHLGIEKLSRVGCATSLVLSFVGRSNVCTGPGDLIGDGSSTGERSSMGD